MPPHPPQPNNKVTVEREVGAGSHAWQCSRVHVPIPKQSSLQSSLQFFFVGEVSERRVRECACVRAHGLAGVAWSEGATCHLSKARDAVPRQGAQEPDIRHACAAPMLTHLVGAFSLHARSHS